MSLRLKFCPRAIACPGLAKIIVAMALTTALAAIMASPIAWAGSMPNATHKVSVTAREQSLAGFLQNLFASVNVPAQISTELGGVINGHFAGRASRVLTDVARVYNLATYFDGSVMHVMPVAALTRQTFAVTPAQADRLLRVVAELGLTDSRNTLHRSSDGSILASGLPRFIEQLDELVRAEQVREAAATGTADFRVFYLRYAWAQDTTMTVGSRQIVVPGVASILRSIVGAQPSQPLGRETVLRPTEPGLRGQGLAAQGASLTKSGSPQRELPPGLSSNEREAGVDRLATALAHTAQPAAATNTQPQDEQVRIEADPRMNAIIVRDLTDRLARYEQLIAALDIEPQSVEIEATIIDINTDRMRELGIDWRVDRSGNSLSFGGAIPSEGAGGVASMVIGSITQFFARVRALQAEGAARIVSSPQVVTLSNVEAVFDNSSTFYVRVAGREQVDLFNVSAGTTLRVTPNVFRDNNATRIKLMINVQDGNLTGRQVDQIPVVEQSSINTQALIHEGESLLIGGMVRDSAASSSDKVPGLGDVPFLGALFRSEGNSNTRIERMFLITPRIASSRPVTPALAPARPPAAASPGLQAQESPPAPTRHTAEMLMQARVAVTVPRRESAVFDLNAWRNPNEPAKPASVTRSVTVPALARQP